MSMDNLRIDWDGLDELINEFEGMERNVDQYIYEAMNGFRFIPELGAKALTPVLTNELTQSIVSSRVILVGNIYEFTVGTNLHYAVRMHEHRGGWGEGTRAKQKKAWRGYIPGAKFLENAVKGSEQDWNKAMDNVLTRLLDARG